MYKNNSSYNKYIYSSIYFTGLLHWYLFFYYKFPSLYFEDWNQFLQIYDVYKQSWLNMKIPFHATLFESEIDSNIGEKLSYGTIRFLAFEWSNILPQTVFLIFLDFRQYVLLNYFIFFSISFYYLVRWSIKLNLSIYASIYLLIIFLFNGKFMAQTAFGGPHMAYGYFLLPVFFWYLYAFIKKNNYITSLKLLLFYVLLLMQTDAHITYQFFLVSSATIIFYPKKYFNFLLILLLFIIVSMWYILPVGLFSKLSTFSDIYTNEGGWRMYGLCGYGIQNGFVGEKLINYGDNVFLNILYHLINIFNHLIESLTVSYNTFYHNTHEYNIYVSWLGFFTLIISLIYFIKTKLNLFISDPYKHRYIFSVFIIIFLSISCSKFWIISMLNNIFTFSTIDSVPSRLMFSVFTFILILSAIGFSKLFENLIKFNFFKSIILIILFILLLKHSYNWWIFNAIQDAQSISNLKPFTKLYNISDIFYKNIVIFSYCFSFILTSTLFILLFIHKNKKIS